MTVAKLLDSPGDLSFSLVLGGRGWGRGDVCNRLGIFVSCSVANLWVITEIDGNLKLVGL